MSSSPPNGIMSEEEKTSEESTESETSLSTESAESETSVIREPTPLDEDDDEETVIKKQIWKASCEEFSAGNFSNCVEALNCLARYMPSKYLRHAIALGKYFDSKLTATDDFKNELLLVCKEYNIPHDLDSIGEVRDVSDCVIYYNLAVASYYAKNHEKALAGAGKLFDISKNLALPDDIARMISKFYIHVLLELDKPQKALEVIGEIVSRIEESAENESSKTMPPETVESKAKEMAEYKMRLTEFTTMCHLRLRDIENAAKHISILANDKESNTDEENDNNNENDSDNENDDDNENDSDNNLSLISKMCFETDEMFKARLTHKKFALKMYKIHKSYLTQDFDTALECLEKMDTSKNYFVETGDSIPLVVYNNLGCVHHSMGRFSKAVKNFKYARSYHDANARLFIMNPEKPLTGKPAFVLNTDFHAIMRYNEGIAYLFSEQFEPAFNALTSVTKAFPNNPRLWLRIAECCVKWLKIDNKADFAFASFGEHSVEELFPASNRLWGTVFLKLESQIDIKLEEQIKKYSNPSSEPHLSLETAWYALNYAYFLLVQDPDFSPCGKRTEKEMESLKASILLTSAYVKLCMNEPKPVVGMIKKLFELEVNPLQRSLANMYLAEAYLILDEPERAIEILGESINFIKDETSYHSYASPYPADLYTWLPSNEVLATATLQLNLAVALAHKGMLNQAKIIVNELWDEEIKNGRNVMHVQLLTMMLYTELATKGVETGKVFAMNHCLYPHTLY